MFYEDGILITDLVKKHNPRLSEGENFRFTSDPTAIYNCASWVLGINNRAILLFDEHGDEDYTLDTYTEFYRSYGFIEAADLSFEEGFTKIVLYARSDGFTHVALQLPNGNWTSKLGEWHDIEHFNVECLANKGYGKPTVFMKRPIQ